MRVIEVATFGGPEVLQLKDGAQATAAPGQVEIEVTASSVLSVDAVIREGNGGEYFPVQPPYVPGAGVAGTVREVGEGVDPEWTGRRVVAQLDGGGYAESVVTDLANVVPVPDNLGLHEAAALLHDGTTALAVFDEARVSPGKTVLVQPAAGGLGSLLVQLAHHAGATVVAAARGARKLQLASDLGADIALDYSDPAWAEEVRRRTSGVHVAFTGVGGDIGLAAFELTRRGGYFSNYGTAGGGPTSVEPDDARERDVTVRGLEQLTEAAAGRFDRIERALRMAAEGTLKPIIGGTFPLESAADAHVALADRAIIGKALLTP